MAVIIRKTRILVDVSAAASSPRSYLRHLRPPQGEWRADDDRKSAETDRGQSRGGGLLRCHADFLLPSDAPIERLTERRVEVVSIRNPRLVSRTFPFILLPVNAATLWSWTARGATPQRAISRHVSISFMWRGAVWSYCSTVLLRHENAS